MNDSMRPIIEVKNLKKSYFHLGTEVAVLNNVDFTLLPADLVSIVGKSGVGKSTFLHVAGALDRPTSGQVIFGGRDVFELSDDELARFRNRNIGFVFQFHHLLPEFSALENVMMPALIARQSRKDSTKRAQELLDRVGLAHRTTHRPSELSGGEQQRVAIARALMMKPKVVFADEPTGNLDDATSAEINTLLRQLNDDDGLALIIVTHSLELASTMGRQFQMTDGKLIPINNSDL